MVDVANWLYAPRISRDQNPHFWPVMAMYHQVAPGDGVFIYRDYGIEAYCYRRVDARDCHKCEQGTNPSCLEQCFNFVPFPIPLPRLALANMSSAWEQLLELERQGAPAEALLDEGAAEYLLQLGLEEVESAPLEIPAWSSETDVLRLRKERLTQGLFRDRLMAFWHGTCALSGIKDPRFLRASHIKPWAIATARERMDPRNGLLLAINYDFAFDRGLITLLDNGRVQIHPSVSLDLIHAIGLNPEAQIQGGFDEHQRQYLSYHRAEVFGANSITPSAPGLS